MGAHPGIRRRAPQS